MSGISHYVTETLVANNPENAPTAQPGTPITRVQLFYTDFGPLPGLLGRSSDHHSQPDNRSGLRRCMWPVTMSAAEMQYYLYQLSLSPKHRAIFLAQLGGRADISDAHSGTGRR
jgi:hypothetical protein